MTDSQKPLPPSVEQPEDILRDLEAAGILAPKTDYVPPEKATGPERPAAFDPESYAVRFDKARGLVRLGEWKKAWGILSGLLQEQPDDGELLKITGDAFVRDFPGLAASFYERSARASGGNVDALCNLGHCIDERYPDEAKRLYLLSLKVDPDCRIALGNLAAVCAKLGEHEEALQWGERALDMDLNDRHALANTSMSMLAVGKWREGWKRYRYLLGTESRHEKHYLVGGEPVPRWIPKELRGPDGTEDDRGLVVYGEQGLGDEILFLSMLPPEPPEDRGFIETTPRLAGLVQRSFPDWKVFDTRLDTEKYWPALEGVTDKLEMGGLGEYYAHRPFRRGQFLTACPVRKAMWDAEFEQYRKAGKKIVGLAWTGGTFKNGRAWRSVAPTVLRSMLDAHPDVVFVSLEYLKHEPVRGVLSYPWATQSQDMDDVAALVDSLDLVVCVTTTAVDLCGALGKDCWAMVPQKVSWRYATADHGEEMWFYRSIRCYRQTDEMDWSPVVREISADLDGWKQGKPRTKEARNGDDGGKAAGTGTPGSGGSAEAPGLLAAEGTGA